MKVAQQIGGKETIKEFVSCLIKIKDTLNYSNRNNVDRFKQDNNLQIQEICKYFTANNVVVLKFHSLIACEKFLSIQ